MESRGSHGGIKTYACVMCSLAQKVARRSCSSSGFSVSSALNCFDGETTDLCSHQKRNLSRGCRISGHRVESDAPPLEMKPACAQAPGVCRLFSRPVCSSWQGQPAKTGAGGGGG